MVKPKMQQSFLEVSEVRQYQKIFKNQQTERVNDEMSETDNKEKRKQSEEERIGM